MYQSNDDLTENVVNHLAASQWGCKSAAMAQEMGLPISAVRDELKTLEAIGCVVRKGRTRGTRWYLA